MLSLFHTCQICQTKFPKEDLGKHLTIHKKKLSTYFTENFPRFDWQTKEPVAFKTIEQYENTEFLNRNNLKAWFKAALIREKQDYTKLLLQRRKDKGETFAPSQFAARSHIGMIAPSVIIKEFGLDWYQAAAKDVGLEIKYDYQITEIKEDAKLALSSVIADTRESRVWDFRQSGIGRTQISQKLDYADYALMENPHKVFVERKELTDWCGVMSKGYDRFRREMERATKDNAHIVIIIEAKYSDIAAINFLPHTKYIKATSDFLFKRSRDLLTEFPCCQMVAAGGRTQAFLLANKVMNSQIDPKKIDLQYLVDTDGGK